MMAKLFMTSPKQSNPMNQFKDGISIEIFEAIRDSEGVQSRIILSNLNLTRKQYYSKVLGFKKAGLVEKESGRYRLTSYGKIVAHAMKIIIAASENSWKLHTLDRAAPEDRDKLLEILITDPVMLEALK